MKILKLAQQSASPTTELWWYGLLVLLFAELRSFSFELLYYAFFFREIMTHAVLSTIQLANFYWSEIRELAAFARRLAFMNTNTIMFSKILYRSVGQFSKGLTFQGCWTTNFYKILLKFFIAIFTFSAIWVVTKIMDGAGGVTIEIFQNRSQNCAATWNFH